MDVHIRWLREKIEDEPSSPALIRTVRGFGIASAEGMELLSAVIGLLAGAALTQRWGAWKRRQQEETLLEAQRQERGLTAPQLLAWIDAATQGWMILSQT